MIGAPPRSLGAVQETTTDRAYGVVVAADTLPGAPGAVAEVVACAVPPPPGPTSFTATTVTVYNVAGLNPLNVWFRAASAGFVVDWPDGEIDTRYPLIGDPFAAGTDHDTETEDADTAPTETAGTPGATAGTSTAFESTEGSLDPSAFLAVTLAV